MVAIWPPLLSSFFQRIMKHRGQDIISILCTIPETCYCHVTVSIQGVEADPHCWCYHNAVISQAGTSEYCCLRCINTSRKNITWLIKPPYVSFIVHKLQSFHFYVSFISTGAPCRSSVLKLYQIVCGLDKIG